MNLLGQRLMIIDPLFLVPSSVAGTPQGPWAFVWSHQLYAWISKSSFPIVLGGSFQLLVPEDMGPRDGTKVQGVFGLLDTGIPMPSKLRSLPMYWLEFQIY